MLPLRKHWHNAPQHAPEKEARLVWFAEAADKNESEEQKDSIPHAYDDVITLPRDIEENSSETITNTTRSAADAVLQPQAATAETPPAQTGEAAAQSAVADVQQPSSGEQAPVKLTHREIAEKMKTMSTKLESIRNIRRKRKDVGKVLRGLPQEEQDIIHKAVHMIDLQADTVMNLSSKANGLLSWKEGEMKPSAFRRFLEKEYKGHPRQKDMLQAYDAKVKDPALSGIIERWEKDAMEQESEKQKVVQGIWEAIDGEALQNEMQVYVEEWEKYIDAVDKEFSEAAKEADTRNSKEGVSKKDNLGIMQRIKSIRQNGIFGVAFYTPNEYISAFKKVWTSFQDARKEVHEKRSNSLAFTIGSAYGETKLPYSEATLRRLGSVQESEFNKAKNEYKEELGDDNFATLVGKFQEVKNDPPKAIAVLEAAASHGWLYDIADLEEEKSVGTLEIFGVKYLSIVPSHWDDNQRENYLSTLTRSNNSGQKEERGKGADRVREQTKPNVFKKRFEAALNAQNYWSAIGIAETFIDRGKLGEVSEYLTLTFLEHLRENENARRYMTRPVLEQFGIMGNKWGTANFATTNIVFHVDDVYNLKKNKDAMNGPFLKNIQMIQEDITTAAGGKNAISRSDVIEKASQMLAGKTVTVNGKNLSIFNEKYREYWDESMNPIFRTFEGKQALSTAGDYYQTDASILLLPRKSFAAIFKTGSTGTFDSPEFALNMAGQAILRLEELSKKNPAAAKIFKKELSEKFKEGIGLGFTGQAPKQLIKYKYLQGKNEGEWMLASLIKHGFLTRAQVVGFAKGHQGAAEFVTTLDEQLREIGTTPHPEDAISTPNREPPAAGASARSNLQAA